MGKKHDENKDVRLVSRIAKVSIYDKTIRVSKSQPIGIKTWGRIDFLTHYCGYVLIYDGSIAVKSRMVSTDSDSITSKKKQAKQAIKDNSLKNKKKR